MCDIIPIPRATDEAIRGAGHAVYLEQAGLFWARVTGLRASALI